jgi:hypothetical protein
MVTVFFSYSHRDEDLRDELEIHLAALKRQGVIETWHDRRIGAGKDFGKEIDVNLERADIILLLVSPYFIASDYCYDIEMKRAFERHETGEARVIPVILHPCEWHRTPFGKLRATPNDGRPVSKFPNQHDAFFNITKDIRAAAEDINKQKGRKKEVEQGKTQKKLISSTIESHIKVAPRSSNLRVKREFTDIQKSKFLSETFEYIEKFIENSLRELEGRATGIETEFRKIDANHFIAKIYKMGKIASECKIWLSFDNSSHGSIKYSNSYSMHNNSFNGSLSVEDDGYTLGLKPFLFFPGHDDKDLLSQEGAAELFWSILMQPLQ